MIDFNFGSQVDLADFQDELEEGGSLPFCQVVNPPVGMTSSMIKKDKLCYGLIVSKEQAELVNFVPDTSWSDTTVKIIAGDDEVDIECYHTHTPTFVIVSRSDLEVQERQEKGWRYLGLGYDKGVRTSIGDLVANDTSNPPAYRYAVRYLILFLGADGQPLHDKPLALTGKGGFGGSFGKEISSYFQEFDQAYCRATKSRGRLSSFAQSFVVHQHTIGFEKAEGKMAYSTITERLAPVADPAKSGETATIKRGDRKVKTSAVPVTQLMLPKGSPVGQQVAAFYAEFEDFAKPNRGRDSAESAPAEEFSAVGVIESPEFQPSGNVKAMLVYDNTQQAIVLPLSQQSCLDVSGDYQIKGVKQGGVVVVESATLSSGPAVTTMEQQDLSVVY